MEADQRVSLWSKALVLRRLAIPWWGIFLLLPGACHTMEAIEKLPDQYWPATWGLIQAIVADFVEILGWLV